MYKYVVKTTMAKNEGQLLDSELARQGWQEGFRN